MQFKYTYTLNGQYQRITFPNAQYRDFSYDDQGRLLQLANIGPFGAREGLGSGLWFVVYEGFGPLGTAPARASVRRGASSRTRRAR